MYKQLINNLNGAFTINNNFIVSKATTLNELKLHFINNQFFQNKYSTNCYYPSSQFEIDNNLFFKFNFCFENDILKKIGFEIQTESIIRNEWGNNRDFETSWIAKQMNDAVGFDWENNPKCDQYMLQYNWGIVGVFFDFKNGTYESFLNYKS